MSEKFSPQRTCVCCRKKTDKFSLVRFVSDGGELVRDDDKSLCARGIYVCKDCVSAGGKKLSKALSHVLKSRIGDAAVERLRAEVL